jgi:hypothetical protein
MTTPPHYHLAPSFTSLQFAVNAIAGSHTGPKFDKLIPLMKLVQYQASASPASVTE